MKAAILRRIAVTLALAVLFLASGAALAQNVANGLGLYQQYCQACHGMPPVGGPDRAANNPGMIRNAIANKVPDMRSLGFLSDANLADIAAWIASLGGPPPPPPPPPNVPPAPDRNYTDLWWGGENESGWGLNIIQHATNQVFAVMYTYDANRRATWFVVPGGAWTSTATFTGALYRVTGRPYSQAWAPSDVKQVGTATFTFFDGSNGTLTFSVDGTTVTKPMARQPF